MEKPKISVIIPTYNRAELITKTLDSVFRQTVPPHEIIVVDNCSTDDTFSVLKPLIDAGKIRWISHDKNYERAKSRNTGMEAATGDYVTFLDSDDLLYPQCLGEVTQAIQENPDYKFFHCLYELVSPEGKLLHSYQYPSVKDGKKAIMWANYLSCIGVFLHRDIYRKYRFSLDPELIGSEDWEIWIRISAKHKIFRIPQVLTAIVQHGNRTVSLANADKALNRRFKIIEMIKADSELRLAYAPYLKSLPAHSLAFIATISNANLEFSKSLKFLWQAVRYYPGIILTRKFLRTLTIALLRINPQPG